LRIRAKLNIRLDEPSNSTLLFVVEMWRSFANEGGIIKNTLAERYFVRFSECHESSKKVGFSDHSFLLGSRNSEDF
jgi:hypothetical protein